MWVTWARTLVSNGAVGKPSCGPQRAPTALTGSTRSKAERPAFWLRAPGAPPFSGPCNSTLLVFPEINGLSLSGRQ